MRSKHGPTTKTAAKARPRKTAAKARTRKTAAKTAAKTADSAAKDVKTIYKGLLALARDEKAAPEALPNDPFVKSINRWALAASTPTGAAASDGMRKTLQKMKRKLSPAELKRAHQQIYAFQEDASLLPPLNCAYKGTAKGCTRHCEFHKKSHTFLNPATLFAHYLKLKPPKGGGKGASPSKKRRNARNGGRKTRIRRQKGRGSRRAKKTTRRRKYISLY